MKKILPLLLLGVLLLSTLVGCTPSLDNLRGKFEDAGYKIVYDVKYDAISDAYEEAGEDFSEETVYRVLRVQDPENALRWLKIVEFYNKKDADLFFRLHEREYNKPTAGTAMKQKGKVIFYGTPSVYSEFID